MKKVFFNTPTYLSVDSYKNNGRLYLKLEDKEGYSRGDISVNLPDEELDKNTIFLQSDLNEEEIKELQDTGIIGEIEYTIQNNMRTYPAVSVDFDKLREFDNEGVDKFEKYYNELNKIDEMER